MTPLTTDYQQAPAPRFPWFSKGVLLLALLALASIWVATKQPKPGAESVKPWEVAAYVGMLLCVAGLWQWMRYANFKKRVRNGTWGQPSGWSRLFAPRPTHIGSRGGQYTINHKGNKVYKKRR